MALTIDLNEAMPTSSLRLLGRDPEDDGELEQVIVVGTNLNNGLYPADEHLRFDSLKFFSVSSVDFLAISSTSSIGRPSIPIPVVMATYCMN